MSDQPSGNKPLKLAAGKSKMSKMCAVMPKHGIQKNKKSKTIRKGIKNYLKANSNPAPTNEEVMDVDEGSTSTQQEVSESTDIGGEVRGIKDVTKEGQEEKSEAKDIKDVNEENQGENKDSMDDKMEGLLEEKKSLSKKEEDLPKKEEVLPTIEEGIPLKQEGLLQKNEEKDEVKNIKDVTEDKQEEEKYSIDEKIKGLPQKKDDLPLKEDDLTLEEEEKDGKGDDDKQNKEKKEGNDVVQKPEADTLLVLLQDTSVGVDSKKVVVMGKGKRFDNYLNILQKDNRVKMVEENATKPEDKETKKEEDKEEKKRADNEEDASTSGYSIQMIPL